jgi:AraC-like DNA-binding protein
MTEELIRRLRRIGTDDVETEKLSGTDGCDKRKNVVMKIYPRVEHIPVCQNAEVQMLYLCSGCVHHVINGNDVILEQGDILFVSAGALQEIYPVGMEAMEIRFGWNREFARQLVNELPESEQEIWHHIAKYLYTKEHTAGYLHFGVGENELLQNLLENLIRLMLAEDAESRNTARQLETTAVLALLTLTGAMDMLHTSEKEDGMTLMIRVYAFLETHYAQGELSELAEQLSMELHQLSRRIKNETEHTYTELLQEKRLARASELLRETDWTVPEISAMVGYENMSYFHRIFQKKYGVTPGKYRKATKTTQ